VLWKGFGAPGALDSLPFELPTFLYPINSSFSSTSPLLPHILHATYAKALRTMAPPTPHTTPMTVAFPLEERPLEDLLPLSLGRDAGLVDLEVDVDEGASVLEEREVTTEPPSVFTIVTI